MNHRPVSRLGLALALLTSAMLAGGCDKGSTTPTNTQTSGGPSKEPAPAKEEENAKVDFTLPPSKSPRSSRPTRTRP